MRAIILVTVFLLGVSTIQSNAQQTPKIKNTTDFIVYLKTAGSVIEYSKIKKELEDFATTIIKSNMSDDNKKKLAVDYQTVQDKSQKLYDKIRKDLTTTVERKRIKNHLTAYTNSIDLSLKDIKASSDNFYIQYTKVSGQEKGLIGDLGNMIFKILLNLVKEFVDEKINEAIGRLLDKSLKNEIVIKPWNELVTK